MSKPVYIASYHQSKFGKLLGMTVPEIISNAVGGACREIGIEARAIDVASVGAACNISLNHQGLLSGLAAMVPGLEGKPIESVENTCASGGQAILSVISKLLVGDGDVGIAVGYEKMRDNDGKMDGKLIGESLGFFSHPEDRTGKVFVFPHIFADVMDAYMKHWGVSEAGLAEIAVVEYANARYNQWAQMQKVQITREQALAIAGINRYIVDGLPLKTYDCPQITDGYAALIVATKEGLSRLGVRKADTVEVAGYAQATDPLRKEGRDALKPAGAIRAMSKAYAMAGVTPADTNVAEVHDCFTVMAAIATEVIGKAQPGQGARSWVDGKASPNGECSINTSGGLIGKGHPIGATGVAMVGWAAQQLLGKAPAELQVKAPLAAATFNIGGPICASVCTVLKAARWRAGRRYGTARAARAHAQRTASGGRGGHTLAVLRARRPPGGGAAQWPRDAHASLVLVPAATDRRVRRSALRLPRTGSVLTGGQVVLDFNKAENPPCAFTEFATCPLPPKENQLPVRIEAGERYTAHR